MICSAKSGLPFDLPSSNLLSQICLCWRRSEFLSFMRLLAMALKRCLGLKVRNVTSYPHISVPSLQFIGWSLSSLRCTMLQFAKAIWEWYSREDRCVKGSMVSACRRWCMRRKKKWWSIKEIERNLGDHGVCWIPLPADFYERLWYYLSRPSLLCSSMNCKSRETFDCRVRYAYIPSSSILWVRSKSSIQ